MKTKKLLKVVLAYQDKTLADAANDMAIEKGYPINSSQLSNVIAGRRADAIIEGIVEEYINKGVDEIYAEVIQDLKEIKYR